MFCPGGAVCSGKGWNILFGTAMICSNMEMTGLSREKRRKYGVIWVLAKRGLPCIIGAKASGCSSFWVEDISEVMFVTSAVTKEIEAAPKN